MRPLPGCQDAVVDVFRRERIIERALSVDGCHNVEVLTSDDDLLVTAVWNDQAAYQSWLDHPDRNAGRDELNALLADPLTTDIGGGSYQVALAGSKPIADEQRDN